MAHNIADLTLDEVIARLIAGETLQVSGGGDFSLSVVDSRAILSFYNQDRRAYWNPDKDTAIQDGEIDKVLEALDRTPKATALPSRPASTAQKWHLVSIEAHRFRGLHRHCEEAGKDPKPFELSLSANATLFRGFNGAGKTSLISAVCWCLTGLGHHSQGLPAPLHEVLAVQVDGPLGADGAPPPGFELPAIVPIPTEAELIAVDGTPKVDTWVRLTFKSLADGREVKVERHLQRDGKKAFKTVAIGLENLGLSELALQVGTLMPGIAAATRFDDTTTLSLAVSTLTGLRPLAHFGTRSERLHDRLTNKYPKQAREEKAAAEKTAALQKQTLEDLLKSGEGLPKLDCVALPNDADPKAWSLGLTEAETRLKAVEDRAASDATLVLGSLPPLTTDVEIRRFAEGLKNAEHCTSNAALKGLPSIQLAGRLGELTDEVLTEGEAVLATLECEADALVRTLSQADRADRLRLYGLVARWHDDAHPGHPFTACPVCERDLTQPGAIPQDALLDQSVGDALEQARKADAALLKTAAEWERDAVPDLRRQLPTALQPFLNETVPDELSSIYETALSKEMFAQSDFPDALKPMAAHVLALCKKASAAAPARPPLPTAALPAEIPDNEGLRATIKTIRRAIMLARYRREHAEFARSLVTGVLKSADPEDAIAANERSLHGQLTVLSGYLEAARVFAGIRRQLAQIKQTCELWEAKRTRITKLERAAKAVEPFMAFPALVHDQVTGLITALDGQANNWARRMYKAQFLQAPTYAGLDRKKGDGFTFLASQGKHLVEAHHVMNSSALRAYLSSFVIALWQQVWDRTGGLSTFLMDDPQDLLDPANVANLAATIPHLIGAGLNPIVVSNDFGFIPAIEAFVTAHSASPASAAAGPRTAVWEFSAISTSKCTVSLAPVTNEVRARCDLWTKDPNNVGLARDFVHPVRVRIEIKMWDLLASDPSVLRDPTLNDLLGRVANARNRGERPFNEEPFKKLIELPALRADAPFREVINKAHHGRADQITPIDAETVRVNFEEVFAALDACWLAYARFMGRLSPEQAMAEVRQAPPDPVIIAFPAKPISVIGRLAARERGARLSAIEDATETYDLAGLGDVSLFTLRAPTLGLVAFPGQTLIVSIGAEVRNGDLAVIQTAGRTYARRVGIDPADTTRIALESMPSTNSRVPPTHFVQRSGSTLSKVIGVLFDETAVLKSNDEAVPAPRSDVLGQVLAAAGVVGDSAFPVARDKGHVLLGTASEISGLGGRILAIVTREDEFSTDHFAYLKRLGKRMPGMPSVYYLENVGQSGEGEFVQFPSSSTLMNGVPIVLDTWRVLGTIF
ncbi:MAG: AAA family ATPase [Brevundimonas sp.]|nr:AAA family ATPase [Brevundimonas sp.]